MIRWSTRRATAEDACAWGTLRAGLWTDEDPAELTGEIPAFLDDPDQVAFLLLDADGTAVGLLEGAIHRDPPAAPYAHVEAWYVDPVQRGRGGGRRLMGEFQDWCTHRAIRLLTSDTVPGEYPLSAPAHAAAGFRALADLRIFVREP